MLQRRISFHRMLQCNTSVSTRRAPPECRLSGRVTTQFAAILTPEALEFVARLHRRVRAPAARLLAKRAARQKEFDAGVLPDFLAETNRDPRRRVDDRAAAEGHARPARRDHRPDRPQDGDQRAQLRRVDVFMADFEDANCPTWHNMIDGPGQPARRGARARSRFEQSGKQLPAERRRPRCCCRGRAAGTWTRSTSCVDGKPVSGSAVRLRPLLLPQREGAARARHRARTSTCRRWRSHLEARLWNDVFVFAQDELGVPRGSIKATVLIETVLAAFEMDEILLRAARALGGPQHRPLGLHLLAASRNSAPTADFCLADRAQVTMTAPFMRAYALLLVKTCHRRGAPAMGGMAAQIPIKNDPAANEAALAKVRAGQAARSRPTAATAPGSRTRAWCRSRRKCSTSTCRGRTSTTGSART